jgi:hypothetical protein
MTEDTKENGSSTSIISAKEAISSPHFGDLMIDNFEVVLDHVLKDGLLREIPAIGTAINMIRLGIDIRNRLFLQKLLRFCNCLEDIPEEERQQFAGRLRADDELRRRVGENLVLLLDRFDDVEQKPVLLSRIFEAYITGAIDHSIFQKLSAALDRIKVYSLSGLLSFYDDPPDWELLDDDTLQDLVLCGLASMISGEGLIFGDGSSKNVYRNELGRLFIDVALKENA